MVKFVNVGVSFVGEYQALNNVNVEIKRGEFVYIIGRSGAGKSTFLRLIYADLLPSRGVVSIESRDINLMSRIEVPFLRRQIGVVFQDYKLLENVSVFDNVKLGLDIFYMKRSAARERIWPLLKRMGIFEKRDDIVKNLSGGEKQRVAVARALSVQPKLLILDEALSSLDMIIQAEIIKLLEELKEKYKLSYLVISHDIRIILKLCDDIIFLENGIIKDKFSIEQGINNPSESFKNMMIV